MYRHIQKKYVDYTVDLIINYIINYLINYAFNYIIICIIEFTCTLENFI